MVGKFKIHGRSESGLVIQGFVLDPKCQEGLGNEPERHATPAFAATTTGGTAYIIPFNNIHRTALARVWLIARTLTGSIAMPRASPPSRASTSSRRTTARASTWTAGRTAAIRRRITGRIIMVIGQRRVTAPAISRRGFKGHSWKGDRLRIDRGIAHDHTAAGFRG